MNDSREERVVCGEVIVQASIEAVWQAWTTAQGAETFFAPHAYIDPRPGGAYELFFNLGDAPGRQGSEGMQILALQAPGMLSFTWNAPPEMPEVRGQRTHVTVRLYPVNDAATRVTLRHDGWGEGPAWDAAFAYFTRAWLEVVLPRLARRFESGPIAW